VWCSVRTRGGVCSGGVAISKGMVWRGVGCAGVVLCAVLGCCGCGVVVNGVV
jgi:hypothetical protein